MIIAVSFFLLIKITAHARMPASEYAILNNNDIAIVCFGGMACKMGGVLPFEFLTYLSKHYQTLCDLYFYIDRQQAWYHRGIEGVSHTIDETSHFLKDKIAAHNYKQVIFMGVSAGGYASILFGSLCQVSTVVAFIPRTLLEAPYNDMYGDLRKVVQPSPQYILYGDSSVQNRNDNHHISQCQRLLVCPTVRLIVKHALDMRQLRDSGELKELLDSIIERF